MVVGIDVKQPEDSLMKLRQEIDKIDFSSRRSKRGEALVPRLSQPPGRATKEDDDEEEDE